MTYRDDHDAAVARADALERELAQTKVALAAARRAKASDGPYVRGEPVTLPSEPTPIIRFVSVIGLVIAVAVIGAVAKAGRDKRDRDDYQFTSSISIPDGANPLCEIRTSPDGAEIFAINEVNGAAISETHLGTSPMTIRRFDTLGRKLEARLDVATSKRVSLFDGPCDVTLTIRE